MGNTRRLMHHNRGEDDEKRALGCGGTFYVRAPSINAVRRPLHRAPGGVRVLGRHDRETICCTHSMDEHSMARHWPLIVSRLANAGLRIVPRPGPEPQSGRESIDPALD